MKKIFKQINWKQALIFAAIGLLLGWVFFHKNAPSASGTQQETTAFGSEIWTCAMHPQIQQNEPGQCPLCGMDLTPLVQSGTPTGPTQLEMTPEAVAMAGIQTTKVGEAPPAADGGKAIEMNGVVRVDERRLTHQVSHVSGRIEKLFVKTTGEQVRKGQRVARLYVPEWVTAQQEFLEAKKSEAAFPQLLEATKEKLRQWKITESQIRNLEESGKVISTIDIFAEASGVVMERKVSTGDYVQTGEVLLEIANLSRLWVEFEAYEKDLASIKKGDKIAFEVNGDTVRRPITYIDPVIDSKTRTARLRVEVGNSEGALRPEMFVKGAVTPHPPSRGARDRVFSKLSVPRSAVLWTGKQSVVYTKVPDREVPVFEAKEVVLGEMSGDQYMVISGLEPGAEVVTHGAFNVDAAAQLNNKYSMMNRNVTVKQTILDDGENGPLDFTNEVPKVFSEQLLPVYEAYLELKDVLVASDPDAAQEKAQKMKSALKNIDTEYLSGKAKINWDKQTSFLLKSLEEIGSSDDLEAQRTTFLSLSEDIILLVRGFRLPYAMKSYVQYCPMADDYAGGYWLSRETEIFNPYFGDKMLHCGEVADTLGF